MHGPGCGHEDASEEACVHADPAPRARDWISRLASMIQPDAHVHLEEGREKEMLPWVRMAVEMDPHNIDAYTVGGYWLRLLDKTDDAERFLREGQRNNPDSFEIYFELGRLYEMDRGEPVKAIRLYELALDRWNRVSQGLEEPDTLALAQILGRLGAAEEARGELEAALHYYRLLKRFSLNPDGVQARIDGVEERLARGGVAPL